jgi:hypothetical protein
MNAALAACEAIESFRGDFQLKSLQERKRK